MSRIFYRPMFRTGGSSNEGITSGLRSGYNSGGPAKLQKILSLMDSYAPEPELPKSTAGSDFLIDFGLDLASRSPQGNIIQTAAMSAREPFDRMRKTRMTEKAMEYQQGADRRKLIGDLASDLFDDKTLSEIDRKVDLWKNSHKPLEGESDSDYNDRAYKEVWETFEFSKSGHVRPEEKYQNEIDMQVNILADSIRKPPGEVIRKVAEHKHKISQSLYPESIQAQIVTGRNSWINHSPTAGDIDISAKPVTNDEGQITMYKIKDEMIPFWKMDNGGLTYDYKTGNLYRIRITETDAFFELVPDPDKE